MISPMHANFIENGDATTADALALIAEARAPRARAVRRRARARSAVARLDRRHVVVRACGAAKPSTWPEGGSSNSRPRARAASAGSFVPAPRLGRSPRSCPACPSGRSLLDRAADPARRPGLYAARTTSGCSPSTGSRSRARCPRSPRTCGRRLRLRSGRACCVDLDDLAVGGPRWSHGRARLARPAVPAHARTHWVVPEVPVAVLRQGSSSWLAAAAACSQSSSGARVLPAPRLARARRRRERPASVAARPQRRAVAAQVAPRRPAAPAR